MKVYGLVRLARDPEIRYSQSTEPLAICTFSAAAERKFKREGEPDADFFDFKAFGKQAEFISKYFSKGQRAFVEGELRNENYTNKDGIKIYRTMIVIDNIEFADSKRDDSQNIASSKTSTNLQKQVQQTATKATTKNRVAKNVQNASQPKSTTPAKELIDVPADLGELDFIN